MKLLVACNRIPAKLGNLVEAATPHKLTDQRDIITRNVSEVRVYFERWPKLAW